MAYLQLERAVAKSAASLDAPTAAQTKVFIDGVFEIGIFNVSSLESTRRTELILGTCIPTHRVRYQITAAEIAVAAHGKVVKAFHGRRGQHARRCAVSALNTFVGVQLPNMGVILPKSVQNNPTGNTDSCSRIPDEISATYFSRSLLHRFEYYLFQCC